MNWIPNVQLNATRHLNLADQAVCGSTFDADFDLDQSDSLDDDDRLFWIRDLAQTFVGESNLDGRFESRDTIAVFQAGRYDDAIEGNSTWATGDWDGDADFGTSDLVSAFQDGGYEQGSLVAVVAVPEPSAATIVLLSFVALGARCRSGPLN